MWEGKGKQPEWSNMDAPKLALNLTFLKNYLNLQNSYLSQ